MSDASFSRNAGRIDVTVAAAVAVGELRQMADGSAGVYQPTAAATSGQTKSFSTAGLYVITKAAGIVILDGGRVYWDYSASAATYLKVNDRDFYVGRAVGDAASADTTLTVDLNVNPPDDINALRDACLSVPVGTQTLGAFGFPRVLGGAQSIELDTTNEAQKIDLLSVDGFSKDGNAIVEAIFRIANDGSNATQDFNIGIANGTHATDADSITEHLFCHVDGNSTNLNLQSTDGTTTVTATDTTKDYTEGSAVANRVEVWFDLRNPADIQCYINGVLVLGSTVFSLDAASGPLFLLAHLEKTAAADVYRVVIDRLSARFAKQ